jgi:hypothetical protein
VEKKSLILAGDKFPQFSLKATVSCVFLMKFFKFADLSRPGFSIRVIFVYIHHCINLPLVGLLMPRFVIK